MTSVTDYRKTDTTDNWWKQAVRKYVLSVVWAFILVLVASIVGSLSIITLSTLFGLGIVETSIVVMATVMGSLVFAKQAWKSWVVNRLLQQQLTDLRETTIEEIKAERAKVEASASRRVAIEETEARRNVTAIDFSKVEFDMSNPEPRCPCVLLLDTSISMSGAPISELNAGLQAFKEGLSEDELAMLRVEVAIITFGPVAVTQDFVTADQFVPPTLETSGDTPMGTAINLALDKVNDREQVYKQNGISYYRPWVFLVTDGAPTDGNVWQTAAQRVREAESIKKVAFFPVGVAGADMSIADMSILGQISSRQPLKLQGLNFREMFVWLSTSLSSVSHSKPGEEVPLQSPLDWGSV